LQLKVALITTVSEGFKKTKNITSYIYRLSVHIICAVDKLQENFFLYKTEFIVAEAELKFLSVLHNGILFI